MWVLRKIRYIMKLAFKIIIYINYNFALEIAKQITLIIILIIKLNLHLIRISKYI